MLSVKTNKEVESFQSDFAGGYNVKQFFAIAFAFIIGGIIDLFSVFILHVPIFLAAFVALPFMAPILLTVFYKPDGMSFWKRASKKFKSKKSIPITYKSTETAEDFIKTYEKAKKEDTEDSFDAMAKKIKIAAIVAVLIVIILIAGAIYVRIKIMKLG